MYRVKIYVVKELNKKSDKYPGYFLPGIFVVVGINRIKVRILCCKNMEKINEKRKVIFQWNMYKIETEKERKEV